MTTEPDGRSVLKIGFACSELADWSQVDLHRLSLYLAAEAPVSSTLHLMMTKRLAALYLRLPGNDERIRIDGWFSPGGLQKKIGCGRKVTVLSVGISYCWNISPFGKSLCLFI